MSSVYDFSANSLEGDLVPLAKFKGDVLLIVNTATKCGLAPQFEKLESLYQTRHAKGLTVLGFPCNQFAGQEPGTAEEIAAACSLTYNVTFPMFGKIDVNGDTAHPLFQYLKKEQPGLLGSQVIKWNFTKFLVDRSGKVVARHAPTTSPDALASEIDELLATPAK